MKQVASRDALTSSADEDVIHDANNQHALSCYTTAYITGLLVNVSSEFASLCCEVVVHHCRRLRHTRC